MALRTDLVGTRSQVYAHAYTWKDCVLYALGVGATVQDELDYLFEQSGPRVLPTFAVVPSFGPLRGLLASMEVDLTRVLHGEQTIILHRPIAPSGELATVAEVSGIHDKGKGALVVIRTRTTDAQGEPVFDNIWSIFVRGAGGFGGDRGPEARQAEPPEGPDGVLAPDFTVTETTSPQQAALYRLSGDFNPLHIAPATAAQAGFERPILHGLCTYGYAGRAIVRAACGGDPGRLASFAARFSGIVFPGDTLTTAGWKTDPGRYIITVTRGDGMVVLSNAIAEVAS